MSYAANCAFPDELVEQIAEQGLEAVPELTRTIINWAMRLERQNHLGVGPYERSPEGRYRANGCKPGTVAIRVGKITFDLPRVRESNFYL